VRISPPLGVFAILRKGLDTVAAHPVLVLPPIVLDLFLWFGPRLTSTALFRRIADLVADSIRMAPPMDPAFSEQVSAQLDLFVELLAAFGERFNLFWGLSFFPVAVPSSMIGILPLFPGRLPVVNPLGQPLILDLPLQIPLVVLLSLPIMAVGMGLGTVYHRIIAQRSEPSAAVVPLLLGWIRVLLLTAVLAAAALIAGFGLLFLVGLVNLLFGQQIGILVMGLGFSLMLGFAVYLYFAPYAVIRNRRNILLAMLDSFNIVRVNMIGTMFFLLAAGGLTYFMNVVWLMPEDQSWYTLLAVIGHGFVSALLIAASYFFYQDRMNFLDQLKKKLFTA